MTRQYSDSIAAAAREILTASGVDITQPVHILPLAKQLMRATGCSIDTAKRHIAKQIRLARGELTNPPAWGGRRTPAGGRPRKMNHTSICLMNCSPKRGEQFTDGAINGSIREYHPNGTPICFGADDAPLMELAREFDCPVRTTYRWATPTGEIGGLRYTDKGKGYIY